MDAKKVLEDLKRRFPNEPEYHQAVEEVLSTIEEEYNKHPEFEKANLIERLCIPDRVYQFRVTWMDDKGQIQTNMGYRVQHNNVIGPYKGGIRFHSSVNLSILKFLAFEQTFKNSLTTLPMGGGKGGSDFSPRGKSNAEVMRFCQAFMLELNRHIGPDTDVPAGDIGVGGREVGYMFGMYKKLTHEFSGVFTGKGLEFGGSLIRPEATGYGNVYFLMEMLKTKGTDLKGKTVLISGSGNVAQYTAEKVLQLGGKVLTMSDSDGYIYDPDGIDREKLDYIMELKNLYRGRIREYAEKYGCKYVAGARPWGEKADIALPSATQNEINGDQARQLVANGVMAVSEGANMPSTPEAIRVFQEAKILYATGQGSQCRRRIGFRSRNEPELRTSVLDIGRGRCPFARHHGEHSSELREVRNGSRRLRQLREGCQRRRFHEGSQGYDGSRHRIRFNHSIHKGTGKYLYFPRPFFFVRFLTSRCPETGRLPIRMSQCRPSSGHKETLQVCPLQIQKPDFTFKPSGIPCQTSVTAHDAMARYNDRHRIMRHGSSYSLCRHAPYSTLPGYF